jgi:hypothetical protein
MGAIVHLISAPRKPSLHAAGAEKVIRETASGAKSDRANYAPKKSL